MKNYAYITLLSNDNYLEGVLLMHKSLQLVKTRYPLYCIINNNVGDYSRKVLQSFNIPIIEVENINMPKHIQEYNESKNPALAETWKYCLNKFHIFKMTQFDKIIFLDADLYFQQNVDHVFNYKHMTGAVDGECFNLWLPNPHLNTGFFVVEPNEELFNDIMKFTENLDVSLHDWCIADQEIINLYYNEWPNWQERHLDAMYNVFACYLVPQWVNDYQKENIIKHAMFFHFVGTKPWQVTNYFNIPEFNFLQDELFLIRSQIKERVIDKKITVYAICKDEVNEIQEWMESMWEADYICVLDTGSTDGTYELLKQWTASYPNKIIVAQQIITPWRFDYARNASLKLIPDDTTICVCTDLDERLTKGWSLDVKNAWKENTTRMLYKYAWSHNVDGTPARIYWYDKIHSYGEWTWKFPVHESLTFSSDREESIVWLNEKNIYLHHFPKEKTNRQSYLDLLRIRVTENPEDMIGWQYLMHEYYYAGCYQDCIDTANDVVLKHLDKFIEGLTESNAMFFVGNSYIQLNDFNKAEECFRKGIDVGPTYRENYLGLSGILLSSKRYEEAIQVINDCFRNSERYYIWLERDTTWTWEPYDLLATAYVNLGKLEVAYSFAEIAYHTSGNREDLKGKVELIKSYLNN